MKDKLSRKNRSNLIFLVIFFLLTFIVTYLMRLGAEWRINADETTCYDIMEDFFDGNLTLRGWHFSTGLFLLPSTMMYVFVKIFGNSDTALYLLSSFNWAILLSCCGFCVWKVCDEKGVLKAKKYLFSLMLALYLIVPRHNFSFNAGTHILCVAVSIAIFFLANNILRIEAVRNRVIYLILVILIMGLLGATNTMFMFSAIIPMVMAGVIIIFVRKDFKQGASYIVISVVALAMQLAIKTCWNNFRGEAIKVDSATVFVTAENLWMNIFVSITTTLKLFGINPWGKEFYSLDSAMTVLSAVILLKLIAEIIKYLRCGNKGWELMYVIFFLCLGVTNILAYTFSTMATAYAYSTHLLFPTLFGIGTSGMVSWVSNIHDDKFENQTLILYFMVFLAMTVIMKPILSVHKPYDERFDVAKYLVDNGYTNGYGGFWSASTVSFLAEGITGGRDVVITPIELGSAERIQAKEWLTTDEILQQCGHYLVCYNWEYNDNFSEDGIALSYGKWDDKVTIGDMNIFLWNSPISTYGALGNASYNANMFLTDTSMRDEEGCIRICNGQSMSGPYISLEKGEYCLVVRARTETPVLMRVVSLDKTCILSETIIGNGTSLIEFSLDQRTTGIEFMCSGETLGENNYIDIDEIYLGNMDNEDFQDFLHDML